MDTQAGSSRVRAGDPHHNRLSTRVRFVDVRFEAHFPQFPTTYAAASRLPGPVPSPGLLVSIRAGHGRGPRPRPRV